MLVVTSVCGCYSKEELARWNKEEQRLVDCTKTLKIVEDKKINKDYDIINIITITERNGNDSYVFDYLKRQACEKGGDALMYPDIQIGWRNTSYTAKVIIWKE